jgi:hypothetical protein
MINIDTFLSLSARFIGLDGMLIAFNYAINVEGGNDYGNAG